MMFYVSFYDQNDMCYSDTFEAHNRESLIEKLTEKRFVLLPRQQKYALNLDHVARIEIEDAKQR